MKYNNDKHAALSRLKRFNEVSNQVQKFISPEELLKLAEQKLCPHYVLTDPLTGKAEALFINQELLDWIYDNNIEAFKGVYPMDDRIEVNFYVYDEWDMKVRDAMELPVKLADIEGVLKLPTSATFTPPGVYFLCDGAEVVYVGQAQSVTLRLATHWKEGKKKFDRVYFIRCPITQLNAVESAFIRYMQPKYNATRHSSPKPQDLTFIDSLKKEAHLSGLLKPED